MPRIIACPECGEADDLAGSETSKGIRIECGACEHRWMRDDEPETCATCGGAELVKRPYALTQYSRGTQLSIVGMGEIMLCPACDAEMLEWSREGRAVPFNYRSKAEHPGGSDDQTSDVRITP
jgi:hypothetical protein